MDILRLAVDPSRADIAEWLGYTSIGFWLFAQAPQVVKNARLQSCEGLALPFLCNWLFGDITNLIGCILTDQLPFQTYLAGYFCLIDFTLVAQYIYYQPKHSKLPPPIYRSPSHVVYEYTSSPHQSLLIQTAPLNRAASQPHSHSRTRSSTSALHHLGHHAHQAVGATHMRAATNPPVSASSSDTVRPGLASRGHSAVRSRDVSAGINGREGHASTSTLDGDYEGEPEVQVLVTSPRDLDGSYQAIYEAALDVARAAERAESRRRSMSRSRRVHRPSAASTSALPRLHENRSSKVSLASGSRTARVTTGKPKSQADGAVEGDEAGLDEGDEEEQGELDPAMFESFHSDMTTSTTGSPSRQAMSMSTPALLTGPRGRSLQRTGTGMPLIAATPPSQDGSDRVDGLPRIGSRGQVYAREQVYDPHHGGVYAQERGVVEMRETRSASRSISVVRNTSSRGRARRAAGVAFMSLGMLAGWNGLGRGPRIRGTTGGSVLLPGGAPALSLSAVGNEAVGSWMIKRLVLIHPPIWAVSPPQSSLHPSISYILVDHPPHEPPPEPPTETPNIQRVIGRISAWTCTTLYLTSRLPQIWKNFERKSVEGLSILLFLFAFCGNMFYVMSIVLNPAASEDSPEASHYLLEALPYLLGSGGTLLFDLTIMLQSLIYGSSPPVPQTAVERSSFRRPLFRRRIRYVEEGREPREFGERQPLLSQSVTLVGPRSGLDSEQVSRGERVLRGYGADGGVEGRERTRSLSSDVVMRAGKWKRSTSQRGVPDGTMGLGLERVPEPSESGFPGQ